jgi:hypothetical protein
VVYGSRVFRRSQKFGHDRPPFVFAASHMAATKTMRKECKCLEALVIAASRASGWRRPGSCQSTAG